MNDSQPDEINVCLVTLYYYPVLSGATERFRRYAPKLLQRGIRLQVMTLQGENTPLHEVFEGIEIERFPLGPSAGDPSAALLQQVEKRWKEASRYPEILQIISHSLQGTPAVWRARWRGIACLNTITMSPFEVSTFAERLKIWVYQWLRQLPFHYLVTSSGVVSRSIEKQGVSKKRIAVIHNGVDIQRFKPVASLEARNQIRAELGLSEEDEIILFIGFISFRKGVDLLLKAWPEIIDRRPMARLLLVGPRRNPSLGIKKNGELDADELFAEMINTLAANAPRPERITFTGEVENIEDYLKTADVFVLPSRLEGFANVVAEAMASGLPCVLMPYQGLPEELGRPGREFLLSAYEPEKLAASIVMPLEDQNLRTSLGLAARSWAEKNLDVEKSIDAFAQLYRQLATASKVKG